MNKQDYTTLFNSLYPRFFESEGIRSLPEGVSFNEMLLALHDFDPNRHTPDLDKSVTFGFFEGDLNELRAAVRSVDEDWVQFFGDNDRVFCGFCNGKIASFCLIDDMGTHIINNRNLKIGGPGCVGTVPEFRRRGIGLEMVRLATQILKDNGYDYSYIHYTAVARWYAKLGYETVITWSKNGIE